MQIFSGSSNYDLAKKIANSIDASLGDIEISRFANGETRVLVKQIKIDKEVVIVQSLSIPTNDHLIELCLISDALQRAGATNITAVVPWMGYSKQDKVFLGGEPLSAKVVAQIIQTTKIKKLITFDLHNRAITGFFDIPVVELSAKKIFMNYFRKTLSAKSVVVAPDAGSVKASSWLAQELKLPIAYLDKRRDYISGKVDVVGMSGEVAGRDVIMVDDLIVTGSTLTEAAQYLKAQGAHTVSVAATHHLYVDNAQEKLDKSPLDKIIVTDTVFDPKKASQKNGSRKNLVVLSIAQLIVDELS